MDKKYELKFGTTSKTKHINKVTPENYFYCVALSMN